MDIRKYVIYNVEWQILRTRLLSKNNATGGWASYSGASANLKRLHEYLGKRPSINKVWCVLNLLDAVRMGYSGQNRTGSLQDKLVKKERVLLTKLYTAMRSRYSFEIPSEDEIVSDVRKAPAKELSNVYKDLYMRWYKHKNSSYRNELRYFLDLVEKHRPEIVNL